MHFSISENLTGLTGALVDTFGLLLVDIMSHHKQVKLASSVILA